MQPQKKKSENLAFFLSFVLPGAGLLYLGKPKWAAANLAIVLLIGIVLALVLPTEIFDAYARYIAVGIAGGCGGLAMTLAKQMNSSA